ncbi:MAG: SRPBCC domain-containing protein [Flavobacteriales bacterium]|nr:SRPBCC domain-containing protein [Flavobacteriales bacterium]
MQSSKINDKRQRIELEFPLHCSANTLYNYISSPSGLSEWFADDVTVHGSNYVFKWDDGEELEAELIKSVNRKHVKFRWVDGDQANEFLEFIIHKDEVTDDLALIVIDSVEPEDLEEVEMMWETQVSYLKKHIGA